MATNDPWERKNPKQKHSKLSPKQRKTARSRAQRAGRPYPNLVDNMSVARGSKTATKKRKAAKKASKK